MVKPHLNVCSTEVVHGLIQQWFLNNNSFIQIFCSCKNHQIQNKMNCSLWSTKHRADLIILQSRKIYFEVAKLTQNYTFLINNLKIIVLNILEFFAYSLLGYLDRKQINYKAIGAQLFKKDVSFVDNYVKVI